MWLCAAIFTGEAVSSFFLPAGRSGWVITRSTENRGSLTRASSDGTAKPDVPRNQTEEAEGIQESVHWFPMSKRPAMLVSTVRELIAPALRECPRECGITAITQVDVSADLSYVTVYVSALKNPEEALAYLDGRRRELQKSLGRPQTHKTPQLRFRIDRRGEEGSRIDELLK